MLQIAVKQDREVDRDDSLYNLNSQWRKSWEPRNKVRRNVSSGGRTAVYTQNPRSPITKLRILGNFALRENSEEVLKQNALETRAF